MTHERMQVVPRVVLDNDMTPSTSDPNEVAGSLDSTSEDTDKRSPRPSLRFPVPVVQRRTLEPQVSGFPDDSPGACACFPFSFPNRPARSTKRAPPAIVSGAAVRSAAGEATG